LNDRDEPTLDAALLYAFAEVDQVASNQRRHVPWFRGAPGPVLDVGSGRGIMLALLRDAGLTCRGIDTSEEAVTIAREAGHRAEVADALEHLAGLAPGSLGGIYCSHVIEHLDPASAMRLVEETGRTLAPGGRVVLVTPDPGDVRCFERFWLDPTHVRPYPAKLLRLLLERAGLRIVHCGNDPEPASNALVRVAKLLVRAWFLGFCFRGDRVVVAEKPAR